MTAKKPAKKETAKPAAKSSEKAKGSAKKASESKAPARDKPTKVAVKKTSSKTTSASPVKKVIPAKSAPAASKKTEAAPAKKTNEAKPLSTSETVKAPAVKQESAKKAVVATPAVNRPIEVSNWPKNKVRNMLVSQPKPENDKNPYVELAKKYGLRINFRQFIRVEGLPAKEFRLQKIDILEHQAVILTSKLAVDHFFRMCNEMRITVPESMKYFCINEATAYYLQKYIQYRKRKIFFGHQTIKDLVDVIKKNRDERFIIPVSDVHKEQIVDFLDDLKIKYTKGVFYRTVHADLSDIPSLDEYDILVFFTPAGIKSLKHNFPNFKQGDTRIAAFGTAAASQLIESGYRLDIFAPNPKNPSMTGALEDYIKEANKR